MRTNPALGLSCRSVVCGALVVLPVMVASTPAAAQSAPDGAVDEIVVTTARMRSEDIQRVPVAETAYSAKAIDDAGIVQMGDFIALTPNISLQQSLSLGTSLLTVRGLTQAQNQEAPVSTVIDGVQMISDRQFAQDLYDIQSIEVLHGPQGALYGRNADGGAIIITTKQPTGHLQGSASTGFGSYGERVAQASLSGPLAGDTLLFRISGNYRASDGFLRNIYLNTQADPVEDYGGRGMLKWLPTDNFTADLRFSLTRSIGTSLNYNFQPALYGPDGTSLAPGPAPFNYALANPNSVSYIIRARLLNQDVRDIDESSLKLDYATAAGTLTSVTAWSAVSEYWGGKQYPYTSGLSRADLGGIDGTNGQYVDSHAWQEELRFTSPESRRLRWIVGGFFLYTEKFISTNSATDLGYPNVIPVETVPYFNSPTNPTVSFLADENHNLAFAGFGNLSYSVTDDLEASFAYRYDVDRHNQYVSPYNTAGTPGAHNYAQFSRSQPKITLADQVAPGLNVYASWGTGFRSGEFNQNGVGALAAAVGLNGVRDVVQPEVAKTYEIGLKSLSWNDRLRVTLAAYHTRVTNTQYFDFLSQINGQVLVNIDQVNINGGEIEAAAHLAPGLDMTAALGITDAIIKKFAINPADVGNRAPYVPSNTANMAVQYRRALSGSIGLYSRFEWDRKGNQFWDPENTAERWNVDLFNLRLGVESLDARWSLIGNVDNLFNHPWLAQYAIGGFAQAAPPRTWRITAKYSF
ncbi:MAG TPA: TonB-dependent receptor [Steroidobacteraceae bacterium]|nr:TonB-dependent receptor [Steroidobacteraceae bacterium]